MCLSKCKKISIGEDKTVYKVFDIYRQYGTGKVFLYSPYYPFMWGECDGKVRQTFVDAPVISPDENLYEGAFHSFANLNLADLEARHLSSSHPCLVFAVVKCTIPTSSDFVYEGSYASEDAVDSYASESLAPVEELNRYCQGQTYSAYADIPSLPVVYPVL